MTTTVAQGEGGQSGNDVWVPLLSALFGAIVGGLAAAVGAYVLQRMQLKKTTRIRMYDELQPALYREFRDWSATIIQFARGYGAGPIPPPTFRLLDRAGALCRAGVIAGAKEAQITDQLWDLIMAHLAYDETGTLVWRPDKGHRELSAMNKELERLSGQLEQHLKRKLTRYRGQSQAGDGRG